MQIKTANGRQKLAMSRKEWEAIGKQAGWSPELEHPLDRKTEVLHGIEGPEENYFRRVWACLSNIVAETTGVSEKAFAANDEIHQRVDELLRIPDIMQLVEESEERGHRPELCAERLYASCRGAFDKEASADQLGKEAMGTSRNEAIQKLLRAQEIADNTIMELLNAGEVQMADDLKRAWRGLGDSFGHVMRFL